MGGFRIDGPKGQEQTKADKVNAEAQKLRQERAAKAERELTDAKIQEALSGPKPNGEANIARMIKRLNETQAKSDYLKALRDKEKAEAEARARAEAEAKAEAQRQAQAKLEAKKQEVLKEFGDLRSPSIVLHAVLSDIGLPEAEVDKIVDEYTNKRGFGGMRPQPGT